LIGHNYLVETKQQKSPKNAKKRNQPQAPLFGKTFDGISTFL
jgi:hypothetical protein